VGFSYSNTPSDYTTGDHQAAADNYYRVIRAFLERLFPERRGNDFYISSELYGGYFMPQCK
jgi:carboxypeptidase C (cathepsin A)